jgi:hypothetical protein
MSNQKIPPEDADANSPKSPDRPSEAERSIEQIDRISARAHFKSQHRTASAAGSADKDWLEAEREIDSATKGDRH